MEMLVNHFLGPTFYLLNIWLSILPSIFFMPKRCISLCIVTYRLCYQLVSVCYDLDVPFNIVIGYGKPQSQVRIQESHGYIRFLLFPRKPVYGKWRAVIIITLIHLKIIFVGTKDLYDSGQKPPFCAACELAGCVTLGTCCIIPPTSF